MTDRNDHPTDSPAGDPNGYPTALPIRDAATFLDISENAVRKRIKRGTLTAIKVEGEWRVFLPGYPTDHPIDSPSTPPAATPLVDTDQATTPPPQQDALIEQLRSENRRLWEEVEARREETRRLHILAAQQQESITALAGRIQALAAGPPTMHDDAPTSPQDAPGASERGETDDSTLAGDVGQASRLRSWWEWVKRH